MSVGYGDVRQLFRLTHSPADRTAESIVFKFHFKTQKVDLIHQAEWFLGIESGLALTLWVTLIVAGQMLVFPVQLVTQDGFWKKTK